MSLTAGLLWAGVTLAAAAVVARDRQSPVERPWPAAVVGGAGLGLVTAAVGLGWVAQVGVVVAVTLGLATLLWRWRVLVAENNLAEGVGGNRLVGRTGVVEAPVDPAGRSGTVRLGTERWCATAASDATIPEGHAVTVVDVEGIHVIVQPAESGGPE